MQRAVQGPAAWEAAAWEAAPPLPQASDPAPRCGAPELALRRGDHHALAAAALLLGGLGWARCCQSRALGGCEHGDRLVGVLDSVESVLQARGRAI